MSETVDHRPAPGTTYAALAVFGLGIVMVGIPVLALLGFHVGGIAPKQLWFLFSAGCGVVGLGYFATRQLWATGVLFMSFFVGGAAQLWLTQPLWFPAITVKPAHGMLVPMASLICFQALVVLYFLSRQMTAAGIINLIRGFGPLRIVLFFALSTAFSVSIMGYLPQSNFRSFVVQIGLGGILIGVNLATLAALTAQPIKARRGISVNVYFLAFAAFAISAALAYFGFQGLPHVEDEVAYLFQAHSFAGGALTTQQPPLAAQSGMEYYLLDIVDGRWFAVTAPGWPLLLTLGVWLSVPWLINPILAGASVYFAHGLVKTLTTKRKADVAALLMASSPWFLGVSGSLMPHTTAIFFTVLGWFLLVKSTPTARANLFMALAAGLCIGWVFVTRQLDGVLVGVATGLWLVAQWRRPEGVQRVIAYSAGCILTGSIYLIYNAIMTGNPLLAPLERYINALWHVGANAYGVGPEIGPPSGWGALDLAPGHSVFEGIINTLQNVTSLQLDLFGWGIGSLALIWTLLIWGRPGRLDLAMGVLACAVIGAMFFYWFSGSFYIGPRYWFSLFIPAVILSASGYDALKIRLSNMNTDQTSAALALVTLCLFGALVFTSWRGAEKYHIYGTFSPEFSTKTQAGEFGNAVVLFTTDADTGSALFLNDPFLRPDRPVFILDQGEPGNSAVTQAFPDRPVIYYDDTQAED